MAPDLYNCSCRCLTKSHNLHLKHATLLTLINGVVARQLAEIVLQADVFLGSRLLGSMGCLMASTFGANTQAAVDVVGTLAASASGHGMLKAVLVGPALEVVAVQAVSSGVAVGVDPAVEVSRVNRSRAVKEFVEDGDDGYGVGLGAHATVIVSDCRKGHLVHCQLTASCSNRER